MRVVRLILAAGVVGAGVLCCSWRTSFSLAEAQVRSGASPQMRQAPSDCVEAAKQVLGRDAEVLKYGDLNRTGTSEAVAVVRIARFPHDADGIPVASLVVLKRRGNNWVPILRAGRQVQNEVGYIGIDYIDDGFAFYGYRVLLTDRRADGSVGFTIGLTYMGKVGNLEGVPMEVSWNARAARYQEFASNSDPSGFRPELKNPPHRTVGHH